MTRARIIALLDALVLELGNNVPRPRADVESSREGDQSMADAEWAYVKGIAAGRVMQLRDDLIAQGR